MRIANNSRGNSREKQVIKQVKHPPLNPRQLRFIEAYIQCGNGGQAAIAAGFSKNGARVRASEILARPDARAELRRRSELLDDELHDASAIKLSAHVRSQLLDYFYGDHTAATRAVESVILSIVEQADRRTAWGKVWTAVRAQRRKRNKHR